MTATIAANGTAAIAYARTGGKYLGFRRDFSHSAPAWKAKYPTHQNSSRGRCTHSHPARTTPLSAGMVIMAQAPCW